MTMDVRMTPSEIMTAQDEEENPTFNWHCREGPIANIDTVASEFCEWRSLAPVRHKNFRKLVGTVLFYIISHITICGD